MRNRHLLKGGNDEALILAGSSDISFCKCSVVQAGLQAARTGWRVMRDVSGLRLPAVPIVFSTIWPFMNVYGEIVVLSILGCLRCVFLSGEEPGASWMESPGSGSA